MELFRCDGGALWRTPGTRPYSQRARSEADCRVSRLYRERGEGNRGRQDDGGTKSEASRMLTVQYKYRPPGMAALLRGRAGC